MFTQNNEKGQLICRLEVPQTKYNHIIMSMNATHRFLALPSLIRPALKKHQTHE